jgi:protein phosphatase
MGAETVVPDAATRITPVVADMANLSHRGHVRARNEDFCRIDAPQGLSIVADGVGGHGDGQWASEKAVALVTAILSGKRTATALRQGARETIIAEALQVSNDAMMAENATTGAPSGCTIAGVWSGGSPAEVTAFNVGDSPIFHLSEGRLRKVSRDHSLFQLWVDGGRTGKEPSKRMIVQAMGISEPLTPYLASFEVQPGDAILLCTDGLIGALTLDQIRGLLLSAKSAQEACELLIGTALSGPAADNLTVSVSRY